MKCQCNKEIEELLKQRKFAENDFKEIGNITEYDDNDCKKAYRSGYVDAYNDIVREIHNLLKECPYLQSLFTDETNININKESNEPIYQQIYRQIKELIEKEELKSDDILPSISSLSKRFEISDITIKKAYINLEKDGYIYTGLRRRKYVN